MFNSDKVLNGVDGFKTKGPVWPMLPFIAKVSSAKGKVEVKDCNSDSLKLNSVKFGKFANSDSSTISEI